ncbi:hypothetical protein [Thermaerobacter subterraneus]|uniref:hypothetical protein n=1 Tax=Thermaerobacter subterraneus TaxID=175696 RepID=UPI0002FBFC11|nr:hypothetical protein [Thermaerobacter subterraneus]
MGIGNGIVQPLIATLWQEQTPNHLLGRALGLVSSLSGTIALFTMAITGPLGEIFGVRAVYVTAASVAVAIALLARTWPWSAAVRAAYAGRMLRT